MVHQTVSPRERVGSGDEAIQDHALDFAMCHSHITEVAKICNPNVFSFLFEWVKGLSHFAYSQLFFFLVVPTWVCFHLSPFSLTYL